MKVVFIEADVSGIKLEDADKGVLEGCIVEECIDTIIFINRVSGHVSIEFITSEIGPNTIKT